MQPSFPRNYYYPPPPSNYYYPPPPPPPTPPHCNYYGHMYRGYYPSPSSYYYNPFPGSWFNVGGNQHSGPGTQRNGSLILGNGSELSNHTVRQERRKATIIGGCHGNQGGHQVSGNINLGDI